MKSRKQSGATMPGKLEYLAKLVGQPDEPGRHCGPGADHGLVLFDQNLDRYDMAGGCRPRKLDIPSGFSFFNEEARISIRQIRSPESPRGW